MQKIVYNLRNRFEIKMSITRSNLVLDKRKEY